MRTLMIRLVCIHWFLTCLVWGQDDQREVKQHTNNLAKESSPYLLQHAHNPVDWYPWSDVAFAKAKQEGKLVFLSVGYAACHWCHVMERESFVDPEIAQQMNDQFVCVKVDREERPDIDQIYMRAVQLTTNGNGGWPMSVFLLPDGRPFWGGTYFPARTGDRENAIGFVDVMDQINTAWREKREQVERQAAALTNAIKKSQQVSDEQDVPIDSKLVTGVAEALSEQFDSEFGGFGFSYQQPNQPKFPEPSNLFFLLDRSRRKSVNEFARESAQRMLIRTLDGMISGAMYDHLGGGFHRYSVDRQWQIPHFEKMLYDNAQLASIYAESYSDSKRSEYRSVAQGICDFVIRELRSPGGGFFSSIDADSEGEEGRYYRWQQSQWTPAAGTSGYDKFLEVYRMAGEPNFEGKFFVPSPGKPISQVAEDRNQYVGDLVFQLEPTRQRLFNLRSQRERPPTDTKILTAWNGLMIAGLADCGRILQRNDYIDAAVSATEFVLQELRTADGRLQRCYAGGKAKLNAYAEDYAFLVHGLLALHRATGQPRWLDLAAELTNQQQSLFWDDQTGGYFFTSSDHPTLIVRSKSFVDAAIPAANTIAAHNLSYLAEHKNSERCREVLQQLLNQIAVLVNQAPQAAPRAAVVLAAFIDQSDSDTTDGSATTAGQ